MLERPYGLGHASQHFIFLSCHAFTFTSHSMVERPFSFQMRDEERQAIKQAVATAAKDPNRFQVGQ
jgi:hypothetical protein